MSGKVEGQTVWYVLELAGELSWQLWALQLLSVTKKVAPKGSALRDML